MIGLTSYSLFFIQITLTLRTQSFEIEDMVSDCIIKFLLDLLLQIPHHTVAKLENLLTFFADEEMTMSASAAKIKFNTRK